MFFTLARGCDGPATEMGKAETNTYAVQCDEDNEPYQRAVDHDGGLPGNAARDEQWSDPHDQAHPTAPQASAAQRRQCPGERTQGGNVTGPERRDAVEHLHDQRDEHGHLARRHIEQKEYPVRCAHRVMQRQRLRGEQSRQGLRVDSEGQAQHATACGNEPEPRPQPHHLSATRHAQHTKTQQ